jgi:hypothetical protein
MLATELRDTANTRILQPNGTYLAAPKVGSGKPFSVHAAFIERATQRAAV